MHLPTRTAYVSADMAIPCHECNFMAMKPVSWYQRKKIARARELVKNCLINLLIYADMKVSKGAKNCYPGYMLI